MNDPTPAEIDDRCKQVQATWSERQRRYREVCPRKPVTVPVVKVDWRLAAEVETEA